VSEAKRKAERAKQELTLTNEAFDAIRVSAINRVIGADLVHGDAQRLKYAAIVQAIDEVRAHLRSFIETGRIEEFVEEQKELIDATT